MHPYQHALEHPDRAAVIMAESGETITYSELDRRSNQGAHLFRSIGLNNGDVVAIFLPNGPRYLEIVWAAQRSGLYYVGVPTRLTSSELAHILNDSGAKALIHSPDLAHVAACAAKEAGNIRLYSCGNPAQPATGYEACCSSFPETPIADEAPGQDMLYSSGTTGRPKGIYRPPLSGRIEDETITTVLGTQLFGFSGRICFLSPAPLYHAAPLRYAMSVHQLGGTVIVMEKFDPEAALKLIEQYRVTHAQWVPTHFVRLLSLSDNIRARYDLSSLTTAFHAAAPCPVDIKHHMLNWWGPIIHEYYSSTESIGLTALTPQEWLERPGSVGREKFGKIHICGEDGAEVPPRTEGLIYFSGGKPLTYFNDTEKTREAHNDRGWATVGDIGWVDEAGYLFLTDRKSYMIISGGVNIYPQEIEDALASHPAVADVAVIGAPDPEMGEKVVAVIQPADGKDASDNLTNMLKDYLREKVSPIKIPRQFDYVQQLPREPTGKLFKRLIRDQYWVTEDTADGGRA